MPTDRPANDPAQTDRWWTGYHPRAAAPAVAGAATVSLLVWTGRWYLDDLSELAARFGALAVFALAWGVWPALAAVYLYRATAYTYRLTDRAVLVDFGFRHRPVPPLWLSEITEVRSGARWAHRLFGVGWVEIHTAGRVVRLVGVRRAAERAAQIQAAAGHTNGAPPGNHE